MAKNQKSKIEQYVIEKVKEIRFQKGYSQDDLALFLDTTRGFIGQVESPNFPTKYNLNHLNTLAKEFKCSMKEFFPDKPFPEKEQIDNF